MSESRKSSRTSTRRQTAATNASTTPVRLHRLTSVRHVQQETSKIASNQVDPTYEFNAPHFYDFLAGTPEKYDVDAYFENRIPTPYSEDTRPPRISGISSVFDSPSRRRSTVDLLNDDKVDIVENNAVNFDDLEDSSDSSISNYEGEDVVIEKEAFTSSDESEDEESKRKNNMTATIQIQPIEQIVNYTPDKTIDKIRKSELRINEKIVDDNEYRLSFKSTNSPNMLSERDNSWVDESSDYYFVEKDSSDSKNKDENDEHNDDDHSSVIDDSADVNEENLVENTIISTDTLVEKNNIFEPNDASSLIPIKDKDVELEKEDSELNNNFTGNEFKSSVVSEQEKPLNKISNISMKEENKPTEEYNDELDTSDLSLPEIPLNDYDEKSEVIFVNPEKSIEYVSLDTNNITKALIKTPQTSIKVKESKLPILTSKPHLKEISRTRVNPVVKKRKVTKPLNVGNLMRPTIASMAKMNDRKATANVTLRRTHDTWNEENDTTFDDIPNFSKPQWNISTKVQLDNETKENTSSSKPPPSPYIPLAEKVVKFENGKLTPKLLNDSFLDSGRIVVKGAKVTVPKSPKFSSRKRKKI